MSKPTLQQQVALLRSAVIGLIGERDPEGEYRPEFVQEVFKDLARKPTRTFKTFKQFLKEIADA